MGDFERFAEVVLVIGNLETVRTNWRDEYREQRHNGSTALHWACRSIVQDSEGIVRMLLDKGCNIEAETVSGKLRPIHMCASWGNQNAMRVLIEAGCCLTALTPNGASPLQMAESHRRVECASMLRTATEGTAKVVTTRACRAITMSNFDLFVIGPIVMGDITEAVRMWREEYANKRRFGGTALHRACECTGGDREGVVRLLVERGCDIEAETDDNWIWLSIGWRPLHFCASSGHRGAMRVLLEAGCCLTALTAEGETPLQIAKRENHHECALMLRSALQTMYLELLKNNSIYKIVEPETGKILLDNLLDWEDQEVSEAIKVKQVDEQEMNEWRNLEVNRVDPRSLRSLHELLVYRCIHQRYVDGVFSLCSADIVNSESLFMGPTALETAVDCEGVVWVHAILRKLVKVDESWARAESVAREKGLSEILEMISKRREYLNRKEKKGLSRLHIAVIEDDPDTVNYLLNNNIVNADASHKNLGTALSLAYNIDHMECVQSLLANNVDVNTVDRFMQTPLHVAISNKTEDHCEYLVDNTRNIEDEDVFHLTVLTRSILNDCRDICERLVRKGAVCARYIDMKDHLSVVNKDISLPRPNIKIMRIKKRETLYSLCLKFNRTIYSCLLATIDRHSVDLTDSNYNTLLHLSATLLMPDLCSQLIDKSANVDLPNCSGRTPLMELLTQNINRIATDVIETVNVLIDGGASLNVEDRDGCNVLEKATLYGNEELLLSLIHKNERIDRIKKAQWLEWWQKAHFTMIGAIIHLIDKPLLKEWITGDLIRERLEDDDISLAKMLYDHGTSEVKIGVVEAILYRAAVMNRADVFEEIIKDDVPADNSLDIGESLLNRLIRDRKDEFIQLILDSRHCLLFMKKKGAYNQLPLLVCIECEYWDIMEQMIPDKSVVNEEDDKGVTPLSLLLAKIAKTKNNRMVSRLMKYVKLLITKGADINRVNKYEETVISYCMNSDIKMKIKTYFEEAQEAQSLTSQSNICDICHDRQRNCCLQCGHMCCMTCAAKIDNCHMCRGVITDRIKAYP